MDPPRLPPEIHAKIVQSYLRISDLDECLKLRLVNKHFNREVFHVLFDQGEVSKRLYRDIVRRKTVDLQFACRYWDVFFREEILKHRRRHRCSSSHKSESQSSTNSTAQVSSGNESRDTDSRESSDRDKLRSVRRLNRVREVIHAAIIMKCSLSPGLRSSVESQYAAEPHNSNDPNLEDSRIAICTAACQLLGGKDSMAYLAMNRADMKEARLRSRHLIGKTGEFWVLLSAVYSRDFTLAEQYLDHFRVVHRKETKWLERLDQGWSAFAWRSSNKERQWLETLAACMILAANIGALDFFCHLMDLDPGVRTTAFRGIRYGDRNVLEATISYNQSDMFELLIERGWCLIRELEEFKPIDDYARAMIISGHNPTSCVQRDDILRILFIMTDAWQHKHCVEMLLGQAAIRNDVRIIEMILVHSIGNAIKAHEYDDEYGSRDAWQCHKTRNVLLVAARLQHMDILRALLRHRRQLAWIVPQTFKATDIEDAVCGLVNDAESLSLTCLEELLNWSDDVLIQEHFFVAVQTLSPEAVAVFARNMDLDKKYVPNLRKVWLDNSRQESILVRDEVLGEVSSESDPHRTIGEQALRMALSCLRIDNVRILVEQFGMRLTWGAVQGMQVREDEKEYVKILDDLSKLLAEHGMFMQTKIIYTPSFHPLAGNSVETEGGIRRKTRRRESDSESDQA